MNVPRFGEYRRRAEARLIQFVLRNTVRPPRRMQAIRNQLPILRAHGLLLVHLENPRPFVAHAAPTRTGMQSSTRTQV